MNRFPWLGPRPTLLACPDCGAVVAESTMLPPGARSTAVVHRAWHERLEQISAAVDQAVAR